jgi:hypothetical protein
MVGAEKIRHVKVGGQSQGRKRALDEASTLEGSATSRTSTAPYLR